MRPRKKLLNPAFFYVPFSGQNLIFTVLFVVLSWILLVMSGNKSPFAARINKDQWEVGDKAPFNLILKQDMQVVDAESTQTRREALIALTPPVYDKNQIVIDSILDDFDRFQDWLSLNVTSDISPDRIYLELQAEFPNYFDIQTVEDNQYILVNPIELGKLSEQLHQVLRKGIFLIDTPLHLALDNIYVKTDSGLYSVDTGSIQTLEDEYNPLLRPFLKVTNHFDQEATQEQINKRLDSFSPSFKSYKKGEVIVRKGFIITMDSHTLIQQIINQSKSLSVYHILYCFVILVISLLLTLSLYHMVGYVGLDDKVYWYYLIVSFIYIIFIVIIKNQFGWVSNHVLMLLYPAPLFCMLTTLIQGERNGYIMAFSLSLVTLAIGDIPLSTFLFILLASLSAALLVQGISKRIHIIRASAILSIVEVLLLLFTMLMDSEKPSLYGDSVGVALIIGLFWGLVSTSLLPILEHFFNWPTPFRLRELSDLGAPIFKRMLNLAPGTFSHSVNVANLAESACREVGANSLLARVGAYYHDIGKIDQADLFIENQKGVNKHDELKPSMSATILKSHVKIGIEKGKELGLPQKVIDIIAQHHGKGLMHFFYEKAKKDRSEVSKDEFSYSGPNPETPEAAIVMLADTVDAATRTLKKPTVSKLDKMVWSLMVGRLEEGLLNESSLNFQDLEQIRDAFVKVLAGYFHTRIEYPGDE
ncbi:HD family phosphohydrolase [Spirochaeta cellobiosiphila]|uniref:HD family phosphohydrolase n=1 Tax=Spirochaeta cellobiosiphila TaxID=504483 RepID=UPI000407C68A|nr:HDIG domain-containing metalloprotein [Spirochaeta cellobiosiphila]